MNNDKTEPDFIKYLKDKTKDFAFSEAYSMKDFPYEVRVIIAGDSVSLWLSQDFEFLYSPRSIRLISLEFPSPDFALSSPAFYIFSAYFATQAKAYAFLNDILDQKLYVL